jgi:hypothetical protein
VDRELLVVEQAVLGLHVELLAMVLEVQIAAEFGMLVALVAV